MGFFDLFKRHREPAAPPPPAPVLARFDGSCQRCGFPIEVGETIERGDRGDGEIRWLHASCAAQAGASPK